MQSDCHQVLVKRMQRLASSQFVIAIYPSSSMLPSRVRHCFSPQFVSSLLLGCASTRELSNMVLYLIDRGLDMGGFPLYLVNKHASMSWTIEQCVKEQAGYQGLEMNHKAGACKRTARNL